MKNLRNFVLLTLTIYTVLSLAESTTQIPYSCHSSNPSTKSFLFCNTTLPIRYRAKDLVSRLTLDEKISQLVNSASAIPRLGIPAYEWWSEALHGVAHVHAPNQGIWFNGTVKSATSFPQVIVSASSFDRKLWYRIGKAIGIEARAVYNAGQATGMTFWTPNINIFRDPRWGRGQETPGEDPLLTGQYAASFVKGLQGDSFQGGKLGDHLQTSACCKHFTAYDLDNWKGLNRFVFDANVTKQDMADSYQPPFKSCVEEGKASGIMCAYNRVNGVPNCGDYNLLTNKARGEWGFNGYITSDCDAVAIIYEQQNYTKTPEDAVAMVLKAGMDINCGTYLKEHTKSAIEKKKVPVSQIDKALYNAFAIRMRLGLFNGDPSKQPYGNIGRAQICSPEHQDLALEAARDGIVLLKNSDNLLPLSKDTNMSVAVIGPNANVAETLLGNYHGPPCKTVTPLQGLQSYVKSSTFVRGCNAVNCTDADIEEAVKIAKEADQVVLVMGLDQTQERESHDRIDLVLPGKQKELITSVAKAAKKPVILVLLCGGPVDISFAKNNSDIGSILWAGYPGEAGGTAIAEIIYGDHNPGGRLPVTWYPQSYTKIPMTDMRMRPEKSTGYPGRTYRFYDNEKIYEFGYGLSYSNYNYEVITVSYKSNSTNQPASDPIQEKLVSDIGLTLCQEKKFEVHVEVTNNGEMSGKHPVMLFSEPSQVGNGRPLKQLIGFETVHVNAQETAVVKFEVDPCKDLSRANEQGLAVLENGPRVLVVGDKVFSITIDV